VWNLVSRFKTKRNLKVLRTRRWGEYLALRENKWEEVWENYTKRRFKYFTHYKILVFFFRIHFDEMGEACGTHGKDHGCIQEFGWRKEFRRSRRTEGSVLKRGVEKCMDVIDWILYLRKTWVEGRFWCSKEPWFPPGSRNFLITWPNVMFSKLCSMAYHTEWAVE